MLKSHRGFLLLMLVAICVMPFGRTNAQISEDGCTTLSPRLGNDFQLALVDPQTNQTVRTEQLPYQFAFEHSPDCRFLIGHSTEYNDCEPGLIIWDATIGERMQSFDGLYCDTMTTDYPVILWNPDYSAAVITAWVNMANGGNWGSSREYLWQTQTNSLIPLVGASGRPDADFFQVYWDEARGWLWSSGHDGVVVFDASNGTQVSAYPNPPEVQYPYRPVGSSFTFSPDHTHVVTHGQSSRDGFNAPAITVYDIATGIGVQVNPELNAAGVVALSPDNRYLTMSYTAIRVWDLHNLLENVEDRLPIYRLPLPSQSGSRVYFSDNTTLIAETDSGALRYVYNMTTGQRIE